MNVGDRVVYVGSDHEKCPEFYPPYGTEGVILSIRNTQSQDPSVQWENGSTSGDDRWFVRAQDIRIIEDDNVCDEEIEILDNYFDELV